MFSSLLWANLRENKMINPAGPGSPGNGPGSKNSAGCATNQFRVTEGNQSHMKAEHTESWQMCPPSEAWRAHEDKGHMRH